MPLPNNNNRNRKKTRKSANGSKLKFDIDIRVLDLMLCYVFSTNSNVSMKGISNLKNFLDRIDFDKYENEYTIALRLSVLHYALEASLNKNIRDFDLVRAYISNNLSSESEQADAEIIFQNLDTFGEMSNADIQYINSYVAERLNHAYMFKYRDSLRDCLDELETGSSSIVELTNRFNNLIECVYKDIRSAKSVAENSNAMDCSIVDDTSFDFAMDKTITELNQPSNFVKTGLKRFNNMLGGGYEASRAYLILGLPKKFKSGILLNTAIWATKYNKDMITKDPTKKPCVVYISMENSTAETIGRIYHYCTGLNLKNANTTQAKKAIFDELTVEGSEVVLKIWYRPNRSISTMDLDSMLDDLASEGYECTMLVQDYAKRIRPAEYTGDLRIDLGNVIDDFTVIAKNRKIPVVTASQLNREAMKILENCQLNNRADIAKQLGSSNVGESQLMIENADCVVIVNKEYNDSAKKNFLTFKLVASRYHETDDIYFAHPFQENNGMKLQEDLHYTKSLSINSISDVLTSFNPNDIGSSDPNSPNIFSKKSGSERFRRPAEGIGKTVEVDALKSDEMNFDDI